MKRLKLLIFLVLSLLFISPAYGKLSKKELEPLLKKYNRAIRIGDPYSIGEALKSLARDDSPRIVKVILKTTMKYKSKKVYDAALEALNKIQSPEAMKYIYKNVDHRDERIAILLLESLKDRRGKEVTKKITQALDSRDKPVVLTAIRVLKERRDRAAVPSLINLLKKRDRKKKSGRISHEIRVALNKITRRDYKTGKEWQNWWDTAGKNPSSGGQTVVRKIKSTGPKFFGETVVSNNVIFVIDVSASMEEKDPYQGEGPKGSKGNVPPGKLPASRMRIQRAKVQLIKVIKKLPSSARFNVIAFNDRTRIWSRRMRRASSSGKSSACRFVAKFRPEGKTATYAALQLAFSNKKVDTIYLLSDGSPTVGPSPGAILGKVFQENRFRKVKIHCFGFPGADRGFMSKLARQNQGEYKNIR